MQFLTNDLVTLNTGITVAHKFLSRKTIFQRGSDKQSWKGHITASLRNPNLVFRKNRTLHMLAPKFSTVVLIFFVVGWLGSALMHPNVK